MKSSIATLFVLGLVFSASVARADTFVPAWSAISVEDAQARCTTTSNNTGAAPGYAVGYSANTLTATGTDFYISACQRPDGEGGVTYVPAWSAISIEDAQARCTTPSNSTGLDAGVAVGDPIYAQAEQTNIFIVVCERPDSN